MYWQNSLDGTLSFNLKKGDEIIIDAWGSHSEVIDIDTHEEKYISNAIELLKCVELNVDKNRYYKIKYKIKKDVCILDIGQHLGFISQHLLLKYNIVVRNHFVEDYYLVEAKNKTSTFEVSLGS